MSTRNDTKKIEKVTDINKQFIEEFILSTTNIEDIKWIDEMKWISMDELIKDFSKMTNPREGDVAVIIDSEDCFATLGEKVKGMEISSISTSFFNSFQKRSSTFSRSSESKVSRVVGSTAFTSRTNKSSGKRKSKRPTVISNPVDSETISDALSTAKRWTGGK